MHRGFPSKMFSIVLLFAFFACGAMLPRAEAQSTQAKPPSTSPAPASKAVPGQLVAGTAFPLGRDFSRVDDFVAAMPKLPTPAKVAAAIGSVARTDWDKARAVYDWLCLNIAYDTEAFFSGNVAEADAETAFLSGKAVCGGYSELALDLAGRLGLQTLTVSGYAKGYGFEAGQKISGANHAWNLFRIDGAWYLMDTTWGAGAIDDSGNFKRALSYAWFAMEPELFFHTHLPDEPRLSLLARTPSPAAFEAMAYVPNYVFEDFFERGMPVTFQKQLIAKYGARLDELLFFAGEMYSAGFTGAEILGSLGKTPSMRLFSSVMGLRKYGFSTASLAGFLAAGRAPQAYATDVTVKVIASPAVAVLKKGEQYSFRLAAPGASEAAVICGETFTHLSKNGSEFSGSVTVTDGPVMVSFRKADDPERRFFAAFEYEVE